MFIMECNICYDVAEPFLLQCKHSVCYNCYHKLENCPFCRKIIKAKPRNVSVHHVQIYIEQEVESPFLTKEVCSIVICTSCLIVIVWLSLMV
jgi:hypothetical protein